MKKVILCIASMLLVFCIIPISTTQAMPRQAQGDDTVASALSVFNQKELHSLIAALGNSAFKDNGLTRDIQDQRGTTLAQNGKSTTTTSTTTSTGKTNPHVKRSGLGKSKKGDAVIKDDKSKNEDNEYVDEDDEDEERPDDDSANKDNKDLKNPSGYNQDF